MDISSSTWLEVMGHRYSPISIMGGQKIQTFLPHGLKSNHIRQFATDLESDQADKCLDTPPVSAFFSGDYFQLH